MLILAFLGILLLVGVIIKTKSKTLSGWDTFGEILIGLTALLIMITLIIWPVIYYKINGQIKQFESVEQTIQRARVESPDGRTIYWNGTLLGDFVPNAVMNLKPIE